MADTMTLEELRTWAVRHAYMEVADAIDAAIRERDRLRGDVADMTEELLRLTDENARLLAANRDCVDHFEQMQAELAALKARIAEAPVVGCPKTLVHAGNTMQTEFLEYTHERMPGGCNSWAGKRVRLVVED